VVCDLAFDNPELTRAKLAKAPALASTTQITREEEKMIGCFGGGYLYAKRSRFEPFL